MSGDGVAVGGLGGRAGVEGAGSGGAGGDVEVIGDGFAMGGEGGEGGQVDRGGRGGRSPLEILGTPEVILPDGRSTYSFGRGGDGGFAGGGGGSGAISESGVGGGGGGGGTPWMIEIDQAHQLTGIPVEELLRMAGIASDDPRLTLGSGGGRGGDAAGASGGAGGGASSGDNGNGQDGVALQIDASRLPAHVQATIFGDGSDGFALFDGVSVPAGAVLVSHNLYHLVRAVQYQAAHISSGVTVRPEGHVIRVKETLHLDGVISASGTDGVHA